MTTRQLPESEIASVLSAIELRELEVLSWGACHGKLNSQEILAIIAEHATDQSPQEYLSLLRERGLVFEVPDGGYRSRMAETVRMLATLRQVFPARAWWQSPELILDYRVLHRPRLRPKRQSTGKEMVDASSRGLLKTAAHAVAAICPSKVSGFQIRSAEAIRTALEQSIDTGVVISAGTGSGKTLAFYLPAIAWIADSIERDPEMHVRTLAIYPRNELLKDQLKTALMHSLQASTTSRPLRIGAWFGAVPTAPLWVEKGWSGWKRRGPQSNPVGWECPYLDCPECGAPLIWRATDVTKRIERLYCDESACEFTIDSERIALTRQAAVKQPPDIMFTTTESLNRQLASPDTHSAFGLSSDHRAARMILLDEVHTYSGTSGAQNAFLLRRLRLAMGRKQVVWVGLSATLLRAEDFFAELVGIPNENVVKTEPIASELESSGAEYLLALRHNPASMTGPLSATIQTAMALQRCLDVDDATGDPFGPPTLDSNGLFGSRTFVFTDKLDVTNRLYWDLLDAEGWWDERKPRKGRVPTTLAHIRSSSQVRLNELHRDEKQDRLQDGQWWWMAEALGHDLDADQSLAIGRTSSQDKGVSDADVIVATATLEVGYDDNRVGAVIQHKAPHDAARFLQRKGRAGRPLPMRPWTVVVLSDWGRDRFAWQAYDQLFDPRLEATRLPTGNRYVRRMQAVYATLDWLGLQIKQNRPDRNAWADLSAPASVIESKSGSVQQRLERQKQIERLLAEVLDGGPARGKLISHLEQALRLPSDEVDALLWTPPRALLLTVIPTAHRRIAEQWSGEVPSGDDQPVRTRTPLSEFIAGNLFDDLLTPEVAVSLPSGGLSKDEARPELLPIFRVLREFLPGNVTRHFGVRSFDRRHWIPLPELAADGRLVVDVAAYGGELLRTINGTSGEVAVYRPSGIALEQPDDSISDSTTSGPVWEALLEPIGSGEDVAVAPTWGGLLQQVRFHMHADGDGVRVCRYTRQSVGTFRDKNHHKAFCVEFCAPDDGLDSVALGAEFDADAIAIRVNVPEPQGAPSPMERSLRFTDIVHSDPSLSHFNSTTRVALVSAVLLCIVECGSAAIVSAKTDRDLADSLSRALHRLGLLSKQESSEVPTDHPLVSDDEIGDLRQVILQPVVLSRIREATNTTGQEERDAAWLTWHRQRFSVAVAIAFIDAASQLVSSFDPSDVAIDVGTETNPSESPEVTVWISEQSPGGNGLVESLHGQLIRSSAQFRQLFWLSTQPNDLELLDVELRSLMSEQRSETMKAIDLLRSSWAVNHEAVSKAMDGLRSAASSDTLVLSRTAVGFVSARLAGPGAPTELASLLSDLLDRWDQMELRSGFAIDARTFGAVCDGDETLDAKIGRELVDPLRRARVIAGLFWPRSLDMGAGSRAPASMFGNLPAVSPDLLRGTVPMPWPTIEYDSDVATTNLAEELGKHGAASLRFTNVGHARSVIRSLLETPFEVGSLFIYPKIVGVIMTPQGVDIVITASELEI